MVDRLRCVSAVVEVSYNDAMVAAFLMTDLSQSDIFNDYATAKMLMHMSNTYFRYPSAILSAAQPAVGLAQDARSSMPSDFRTFDSDGRRVDGVVDYVQSRISSIEIWKKPRYWEYAFYGMRDSLHACVIMPRVNARHRCCT